MGAETTALALRPNEAYEPRNLHEAVQIAQYYADSKLLAPGMTKEGVLLIMATGNDLGIPPTAALRGIHIIKGRPSISADLKVALVMRHPDCEYFRLISSDDAQATYATKRRGGSEIVFTFTIDDARRAQLEVDNQDSNWGKYPRVMLRHRCSSELATAVYPDVVMGLPTTEELGDIIDMKPVQEVPARLVMDVEVVPAATPAKDAPPAPASPPPGPDKTTAAAVTNAAPALVTVGGGETSAQKTDRLVEACRKALTKRDLKPVFKEANPWPKGLERDQVLSAYTTAIERIERAAQGAPPPTDDSGPCGWSDKTTGECCTNEGLRGPDGYRCGKHNATPREPGAEG